MRSTSSGRILWRAVGLTSLFSFVLLAVGFALALNPAVLSPDKPPAPAAPAAGGQPVSARAGVNVVTLGDSLTRGTGDANGQGYVGLVREALEKQTGNQVALTNLAVNGLESTGLLAQLQQPQVKRLIAQADLILFTIGGNDLFHQTGAGYDLDQDKLDKQKIASALQALATRFDRVLHQIRQLNPDATIVYTSLYNPFGDTAAAADTTAPVLAWNSRAAQIASRYPHVIVVPTYDLFLQKEKTYLYTDHFHPNSAGYARIAARVIQAVQ